MLNAYSRPADHEYNKSESDDDYYGLVVGVLSEFVVIRWLYDRPWDTILATIGLSLITVAAVSVIAIVPTALSVVFDAIAVSLPATLPWPR